MKKINYLFAILLVAMFSVMATSCGKSKNDDPTPDNGKGNDNNGGSAKYLTADEFNSSFWYCTDASGNAVELDIKGGVFKYYKIPNTNVKGNGKDPEPVTVKLSNGKFDEAEGKYSATGDDNNTYTGELTSKTSMKFKGQLEYTLTKK